MQIPDLDNVVAKAWYLLDDYLPVGLKHCEKKAAERCERREDTDLSLYVPFLDRRLGTPYMADNEMRTGYPSYVGHAAWFLFHALAQRLREAPADAQPRVVGTKDTIE